jgi:hypothetical protein
MIVRTDLPAPGGQAGWRSVRAGVSDAADASTPRCNIARVVASPVASNDAQTYDEPSSVASNDAQTYDEAIVLVAVDSYSIARPSRRICSRHSRKRRSVSSLGG